MRRLMGPRFREIAAGFFGMGFLWNYLSAVVPAPDQWRAEAPNLIAALVFFALALLQWAGDRLYQRLAKRGLYLGDAEFGPEAEPRPYLIMAPSAPLVARRLIEHNRSVLTQVWLLVTRENLPHWGSAEDMAKALKTEYETPGLKVDIATIDGPFDATFARHKVSAILHELNLRAPGAAAKTSVDITGATALMSLGMAAAAVDAGAHVTYLPTQYQKVTDKEGITKLVPAGPPLTPREITWTP